MKNAIRTLEAKIKKIQDKIKEGMLLSGTYNNKYESLLGEYYTAISALKMESIEEIVKKELNNKSELIEHELEYRMFSNPFPVIDMTIVHVPTGITVQGKGTIIYRLKEELRIWLKEKLTNMDEILRDLKLDLERMVHSEAKIQKHFMGVELEEMDKETLVLLAQYFINKECC